MAFRKSSEGAVGAEFHTDRTETKGAEEEKRLLSNLVSPRFRALVLGVIGLSAIGAEAQAQGGRDTSRSIESKKEQFTKSTRPEAERIPMSKSDKEAGDPQHEYEGPGLHTIFIKQGDGTWDFNYWSLLSPAQLELSRKVTSDRELTFELPYEFSRLFNSGKPLRPEDHEKLALYVQERLRETLADDIYATSMNKDVYRYYNPDSQAAHHPRVLDLKITGTASPEAAKYGPEALKPDHIEQENIDLATLRANTGRQLVIEELTKMGFDISKIQDVNVLDGQETQFSDEEMVELAAFAQNYPGSNDFEKMFQMIVDYDQEKITDPALAAELDRIVGSKRKILVNITLEGDKKQVLIIPMILPFPLFLLLFSRRARNGIRRGIRRIQDRGAGPDPKEPTAKPAESSPAKYRVTDGSENEEQFNVQPGQERVKINRTVLEASSLQEPRPMERVTNEMDGDEPYPSGQSEKIVSSSAKKSEQSKQLLTKEVLDRVAPFARDLPMPSEDSEFYQKVKENTLVLDLEENFDNPATMKYGIDYRAFAEDMEDNYDQFQNRQEQELYLMSFILSSWKTADLNRRREAGVSPDQIGQGLDYDNDPEKVIYAKMHARSLLDLVEERQHLSEQERKDSKNDFREILDRNIDNLSLALAKKRLRNE